MRLSPLVWKKELDRNSYYHIFLTGKNICLDFTYCKHISNNFKKNRWLFSSRIKELFLIDKWTDHVYDKSVINIFNMFTLLVLLSELTIGVWTLSILPKMCPGLVLFIYVLDKFWKSNVYIGIFVEIWSMKFNCFT